MAGKIEMMKLVPPGGISASLQHKGQKISMVAIPALHPGKAVVQVATLQVAVNDHLEVGMPGDNQNIAGSGDGKRRQERITLGIIGFRV